MLLGAKSKPEGNVRIWYYDIVWGEVPENLENLDKPVYFLHICI